MEDFKKYLPWILGGGAVLGGIYLLKSGYGASSGVSYTTVPPPDNSAAASAAAQAQQQQMQAEMGAFSAIATIVNNKMQAEYQLATQKETDATQIAITTANNATQDNANNKAASVAKHNSNNQAIASVAGTILMGMLMFCYDVTFEARNKYQTYTHGLVGA